MAYRILLLLILLIPLSGNAQHITCSPENKAAVITKIREIREIDSSATREEIIAIGRTFLGTPYVAKTLEGNVEEALVIELQGLDCTTFVENVLAFGLVRKEKEPDFHSFVRALENIRYRDGVLNGYGSRLHYFTEWISDNAKKGLVKNITKSLGGVEISKELNFMTQHRSLYPALSDEAAFQEMIRTEQTISGDPLCVLSPEMLEKNEALLVSGDIIALATSIEGLDVTHTGFAIRMPDDRVHLLHASTSGAVEISALPLVDYLRKISKNTGVIVARPVLAPY